MFWLFKRKKAAEVLKLVSPSQTAGPRIQQVNEHILAFAFNVVAKVRFGFLVFG